MVKLNDFINLESSLDQRFINHRIACNALLGVFRWSIRHTDIFENLQEVFEEEGDDEICLQCAEALTGIPTDTLQPFIKWGVLPFIDDDDDIFVSTLDLLLLADPRGSFDSQVIL